MFSKEKFLERYQKVPVEEYPNWVLENDPLVSVCVQTYQHKDFISQCIESILDQKTNFHFEILLGEDASSDGTRDICLEYAKRNPEKIRLFLHKRENNISVYGKPTGQFNFKSSLYEAKGKYIAICEGDDYWIDPLKLQKQIDFLENNPNYGMVYSEIKMVDTQSNLMKTSDFHNKVRRLYKSGNIFWNVIERNFINTLTTCVSKELLLDYINKYPEETYSYDFRLWLHVTAYKKVKFIDEPLAAYRIHDNGMSRNKDYFKKREPLSKQSGLINYLKEKTYVVDNKKVFGTVVFGILKNRQLSLAEKKPTLKLFMKRPFLIIDMLAGIMKKQRKKE